MKNEEYNFDQISLTQQPGLESIDYSDEACFVFTWNDEEGKPLLFSKKYSSPKSRDNGLESIMEYGVDIDNYKEIEEGDTYFFVIRSGNNREIACSRPFKSLSPMEKAKKEVHLAFQDMASGKSEHPARNTQPDQAMTEKVSHTKSRFQLEFYKPGPEEPLSGKIEHLISNGDKIAFQGFNSDAIIGFIKGHLPYPVEKAISQADPRLAGKDEIQGIRIFSADRELKSVIDRKKSEKLAFTFPGPEGQSFRLTANVFAKSLESAESQLIGHLLAEISGGTLVAIPIFTANLATGAHKISVETLFEAKGETAAKEKKGSMVVYFV